MTNTIKQLIGRRIGPIELFPADDSGSREVWVHVSRDVIRERLEICKETFEAITTASQYAPTSNTTDPKSEMIGELVRQIAPLDRQFLRHQAEAWLAEVEEILDQFNEVPSAGLAFMRFNPAQ
jgi:hypothetical protein